MPAIEDALTELAVCRPGQGVSQDRVAVEAPLTLRIAGRPWITLMRSPGQDRALIAGLLRAEAIVDTGDEILAIQPCTQLDDPEHEGHVYTVRLADPAAARMAQRRRSLVSASSCGLCGKEQIEACLTQFPPPPEDKREVSVRWVASLPSALRKGQSLFDETGAVHAAGLFEAGANEAMIVHEDVGRHNAVDKVLGHCLLDPSRGSAQGSWLAVSGRVSFEIVQKAAMHGCAGIVAVSAPTSLAVQLAEQAQMTLVGFTRGGAFVCYAGSSLIQDIER